MNGQRSLFGLKSLRNSSPSPRNPTTKKTIVAANARYSDASVIHIVSVIQASEWWKGFTLARFVKGRRMSKDCPLLGGQLEDMAHAFGKLIFSCDQAEH